MSRIAIPFFDEGPAASKPMLDDWNCPQHITPRFTEEEVAKAVRPLVDRLGPLESENAALRAQLEAD